MHEVMHKTPEDYNYKRTDLRLDIRPLVLCALLNYMPWGRKSMRAPTLDKLERVSRVTSSKTYTDPTKF